MADAFWCPFKICQPTSQIISKRNQYKKQSRGIIQQSEIAQFLPISWWFYTLFNIFQFKQIIYLFYFDFNLSHMSGVSIYLLVRSIVNQSLYVVKEQRNQFNFEWEREKLWKELRSNYKADRDHLSIYELKWNRGGISGGDEEDFR